MNLKKEIMLFMPASICLTGIFILNPFHTYAQDEEEPRFEIESDPIAFAFNGYSLHTAVTYSGFRSSIGIFAIKPPGFLLQDDAFAVYTSGFDLKTDYLFGNIKGFYAGLQLTYTTDKIELKVAQEGKNKLRSLNVGARIGYRFMFGKKENQYKGFYLTPWVALMYNPSTKSVQQGTHEYKQEAWVPFPAFHLGWRF